VYEIMAETQETQGIPNRRRATQQEDTIGRMLRNGEYRIEAVLGQGGMGQVFLASHTALQIPLALKQGRADQPMPDIVVTELERILYVDNSIHSTPYTPTHKLTESDFPTSGGVHTDRFLREALLLARLQHASLPALYDYFLEDGYWYLVMDYIPGPTLSSYMHKHGAIPPLEALNYAMQLCDVLEYLHEQVPPVVFRDLKPSNIILSPDGRVMLVDFGIARYFKAGQMNDTTEFGSPGYAPPEQYQGGSQTDGRSDLYSLGVILHEMLSGHHPAGMGGKLESLHYLNPAISSVLSGLVTVATRTEPIYRFQSAHTFYRALERAYTIEERRAYQQSILGVEVHGITPQWSSLQTLASPLEEHVEALQQPSIQLTQQRQQNRELLQEVRRERLEEERAEVHLASIDESLGHRSSMGISSSSLPIVEYDEYNEREDAMIEPRSSHTVRHIAQTLFVLALIVFVVIASINISGFFSQHANGGSPKKRQTSQILTPAPTSVVTRNSTWQDLPSLPSPEADNTAVYVQVQGRAYIYMSGGFRGSRMLPQYDHNLYRYDIEAAHWEILENNHFPGMGNNAAALDEQNRLFFTAGYSPDTFAVSSLLYMFQPANETLQKIVPPAQVSIGYGAAMVADQQGHLYITQGFMAAGNARELAGTGWYRYDIASGQWHILSQLPQGLGYVVLAPDGMGGILLLGGSKDAGQSLPAKQIYRYNIAQNAWTTEQATAPIPLSGTASCLNGPGQLVIMGGFDAVHHTSLGQTWLVDLQTLRWEPTDPLPSGGSLLGAAACDGTGHVYLSRGANDPSRPTPDFWELSLL
jgi:serine/threonine protein kinase